ncbi:MAG: hypothetical protein GY696_30440, partial [Gammaproteobacteria bacterium]|nr:hypothetical protein [Gammaproteobacteria bacterium]
MATPNTVLTTPYRTKEGQVGLTPSQTPTGKTPGMTPTPIRDKLAINPEDYVDDGLLNRSEFSAELKMGLSSLPAPKNDYEIVVPEDGEDTVEMTDDNNTYIEDQADVDKRAEEIARKAREAALAKRSGAVKRELPRPVEMNHTVLRPLNSDPPLNDLQRAEEMIKREMLVMMHHDALETPTLTQQGIGGKKGERGIVGEDAHRAYL